MPARVPPADGHHQVRVRGGQPVGGLDEHVHALAGDQPADADDQRAVGRQPEPGPRRRVARPRASGTMAAVSTPGGISTTGAVMPGAARRPSAAG